MKTIIKEDKGSDVVILDKTYSKTKIQEILRDETNNEIIYTNISNDIISKITKFCKIQNKTLTKKEKDFKTNYIPKTSHFNGLPKIHKSEDKKKKKPQKHKNSTPQ